MHKKYGIKILNAISIGNPKHAQPLGISNKKWIGVLMKAKQKIGAAMMAMNTMWLLQSMTVFAKEGEKEEGADASNPFGFVDQEGNGMFNDLINTVNDTGASANKLMIALGAVSVVITLGGVGLMIMLIKNGNKREENKSWLMAIVAGAMLLFGAASFAGILYQMGKSI